MTEWEKVQEAVGYIRRKTRVKPRIGIILGTGLGPLSEQIQDSVCISYEEIPHFSTPTAESHQGNLILGRLAGKNVVAMQGRLHAYEGYSALEIVFPVRVMKQLGVDILIESNAAGGLNPLFRLGDLVVISDHINLTGANPLIGPNDERLGPRFPDMSQPYDPGLIKKAEEVGLAERIPIKKGVLAGLSGPNLETKAEYRFLRLIGADMVCMSTVFEVIASVHLGMKTFGISVITDLCLPDALKPASIKEILRVAAEAEPVLTRFVKKLIIKI